MRTRRFVPGQITAASVLDLRDAIARELDRVSEAFLMDLDEVGDSGHAGASETGLLVWVNRGGDLSLDRVSIGAADSGGAGYRVLRVEN